MGKINYPILKTSIASYIEFHRKVTTKLINVYQYGRHEDKKTN